MENGGKLVGKKNGTNDLYSLLIKYIYGAFLFGLGSLTSWVLQKGVAKCQSERPL